MSVHTLETPIVEQIRSELEAEGLTQAQLSRETGIDQSRLNQWLAEKYTGQNKPINDTMKKWLTLRKMQRQLGGKLPVAPSWVETPTARRIYGAFNFAQIAGNMAVVYGDAGTGKTETARHYQDSTPNVWLATMAPATATLSATLGRISEAMELGMPDYAAPSRLQSAIIERMRFSQGLLIVDEAQHLADVRSLETIRSLYDATGVGVVIMGNELVYIRLSGGQRSAQFAQLFSRIAKRVRVKRPTKADAATLIDAWKVKDKQTKDLLIEMAQQHGALRGMTMTLRLATIAAHGGDISPDHVKAAWKDLGGDES